MLCTVQHHHAREEMHIGENIPSIPLENLATKVIFLFRPKEFCNYVVTYQHVQKCDRTLKSNCGQMYLQQNKILDLKARLETK